MVGQQILDDPMALDDFAKHADDTGLHERLAAIRHANKAALARLAAAKVGIRLDPSAMFDVHIKRFHEYKRQLLNILQTIALYNAMRARPTQDWVPRVKIFAGKAAATYHRAKLIIKLVHDVAHVINDDPAVRGLLKVVFLPDYNVSLAEAIIPATDISEQISTAGMEASGTGNMKLALNGALTIGTLDGANIEILERVGDDNIFIFGLTAEQAEAAPAPGTERARDHRRVAPAGGGPGCHRVGRVLPRRSAPLPRAGRRYSPTTTISWSPRISRLSSPPSARCPSAGVIRAAWWRSSVLNTARMGWFSSDRAIREYAEDIWDVVPQRH